MLAHPTSSHTPDSRRSAFNALQDKLVIIEEQIRILSKRAREIRSQQNDVALISGLPNEILAEIFMDLVYVGPGTDAESCAWIKVTHVCSRWRQVALDCPKLWSRPSFSSEQCTTEWIRRAKNTPVHFYVDLDETDLPDRDEVDGVLNGNMKNGLSVAVKKLHLARSLTIQHEYPDSDFGLRLFWHCLQNDQTFGLEEIAVISPFVNTSNINFPALLLERVGSAHLRQLHLESWNILRSTSSQPISLAPSITKLEIIFFREDDGRFRQQSSIKKVISCLKSLPHLKILTLRNIFWTDAKLEPSPSTATIESPFPTLDDLTLEDCVTPLQGFLTQLPIPPRKVMAVRCYHDNDEGTAGQGYQAFLLTMRQLLGNPFRSVEIFSGPWEESSGFCIYLQQNSTIEHHSQSLSPMIVTPGSASDLENTISLLSFNGLEQLRYLCSTSPPNFWITMAKLRHLQFVTLSHNHRSFVELLSTPFHWQETGQSGYIERFVGFPALQGITFDGCNFGNCDGFCWKELVQSLERRSQLTRRCMLLRFARCTGAFPRELKDIDMINGCEVVD